MIDGILVFTSRGELIVSNLLRSSIKKSIADVFRIQVLNNLDVRSPVLTLGSTTFHHIRSSGKNALWLVAITRSNADSGAIWEFLYQLETVMKAYGLEHEDRLKEEFMLCYELMDLMLNGDGSVVNSELGSIVAKMSVPPLCEMENMNGGGTLPIPKFLGIGGDRSESQEFASTTESEVPWRPHGIRHKKNEVFLFVNEKINILVSRDETVLKAYVDGSVELTSQLSGFPICQFGLNDYLSIEDAATTYNSADQTISKATAGRVKLEDCKFHQCVALDKFNRDRVIQFIPPDGKIELMKYHVRDNLNLPFKVSPVVTSTFDGKGLDYRVTLKSLFPSKLSADDVSLRIPVPPGTVDCRISVSNGKCKYEAEEGCLIWRFSRYNGLTENKLSAQTIMSADTTQLSILQWPRPPMSLNFEIMMFSNSGLVVRYFKVHERNQNYRTIKWIKYISKSGSYEVRY